MSTDRETTRLVRSWLTEGVTALPDRVLDAVLDQVPTTPQRRSWRPTRRFPIMPSAYKYALAAAAVLVVAVVGYSLLPGISEPGGQTTAPTVQPTVARTVPPSAPPQPVGDLAPGRYAWTVPSGHMTFEVPAGWFGDRTIIGKRADQPGEISLGVWAFDDFTVTHVYVDACLPPQTRKPIGPTSNELVVALEDQLNIDAAVTDVTVAGQPAKRVDLTEPEGLDRSTCRHGADGPLQIWSDAVENNYFSPAPNTRAVAFILDMEAGPLVLFGAIDRAATPADLAELDAIIESLALQ